MFARNCFTLLIISFCFATQPLLLDSKPVSSLRLATPPQTEDVFARGVQAYNAHDYAKAEKLLSAYLQENPTSLIRDIGLLWYGRTLIGLNRMPDAEKIAQTLEKEFPKSPITRQLRMELGRAASKKKPVEVAKAPVKKPKKETVKPPVAEKAPTKEGMKEKEVSKVVKPPQEISKSKVAEKPSKPAPVAGAKQTTPETKQTPVGKKEVAAKGTSGKELNPKEVIQSQKPRMPVSEKKATSTSAKKETLPPVAAETGPGKGPTARKESTMKPPTPVMGQKEKPKPAEVAQAIEPAPPITKKTAEPGKTAPSPGLAPKGEAPKSIEIKKSAATPATPPKAIPAEKVQTTRASVVPKEKKVEGLALGRNRAAAALLAKAQKAVSEKKEQDAIRDYCELVTLFPKTAEAQTAQSQIVALLGSPAASEKAIREYKEAQKRVGQALAAPSAPPGFGAENRRDPFRPLVVRSSDEPPANLPMGKKGLLVLRLQLKGIVKAGSGRFALVESGTNPAAIFLHEKDSVYDGVVDKILEDRIVFTRFSADKLGKPFQEEVIKKLSGSGMF